MESMVLLNSLKMVFINLINHILIIFKKYIIENQFEKMESSTNLKY